MKNCGTCAYWQRYDWWNNPREQMGGCVYAIPPLPAAVDPVYSNNMGAEEGEDCPVWRGREEPAHD
jgi:hypothetical protein